MVNQMKEGVAKNGEVLKLRIMQPVGLERRKQKFCDRADSRGKDINDEQRVAAEQHILQLESFFVVLGRHIGEDRSEINTASLRQSK